MKQSIVENWVRALRSGDYIQGHGQLRFEAISKFCCLGVLCDVINPAGWGAGFVSGDLNLHPLGDTIISRPSDIGLPQEIHDILYNENDDGKSFDEIADIIEELVPVEIEAWA